MAIGKQMNNLDIITVEQAELLGLSPLTLSQAPDLPLRVGNGATSVRYIEWLMGERKRIRAGGDRRAEIVEDNKGDVSLWVNLVAA